MNPFFVVAGAALVALGLLHSVLGERLLIGPVLRLELPRLFGSRRFAARTLRFAWHLTSVAWWGLAALAFAVASPGALRPGVVAAVIAAVCGVSGATALVMSRGRHYLAWVGFGLAAVSAALGALVG